MKTQRDSPDFSPARKPAPMLSGRLEVFGFLFLFSVLFITFRLFLCRSGAGVDGIWFQEHEKEGLSPCQDFCGKYARPKGKRKISRKTARRLDLAGACSP